MAMVEVGYRYREFYWASRDQNWEYAAYQLDKIDLAAVANGVERRPLRSVSLSPHARERGHSSARGDRRSRLPRRLKAAIETLTATCNACRPQAERVPYIYVAPPDVRLSPVRRGSAPEAERGGSGRCSFSIASCARSASRATVLIRLMVGGLSHHEGIQKFLEPASLGAGRFAAIGIPWPDVSAVRSSGSRDRRGRLALAGLATRLATVPASSSTMGVAIV